jgi:hypothetical protein
VRISCLAKGISDHTPLLVDFGVNCSFGKKKFSFEKWWLQREDLGDLIKKAWSSPCSGMGALDQWQNRIGIFRRLARGWAANVIVELNKHKQATVAESNALDLEAKNKILDENEKSRFKSLARELDKLWALEEIKARQRSRDRLILEGDRNTSYFMAIADRRARKKELRALEALMVW